MIRAFVLHWFTLHCNIFKRKCAACSGPLLSGYASKTALPMVRFIYNIWCTTLEKGSDAICEHRMSRLACASMQSHQGILCSSTYTTVSIDSVSGQRRPWSACAIANCAGWSGPALSRYCIRALFAHHLDQRKKWSLHVYIVHTRLRSLNDLADCSQNSKRFNSNFVVFEKKVYICLKSL